MKEIRALEVEVLRSCRRAFSLVLYARGIFRPSPTFDIVARELTEALRGVDARAVYVNGASEVKAFLIQEVHRRSTDGKFGQVMVGRI
jgi:hypothetical protein